MTLVWVTGNSGTGKSTVCEVLRAQGFAAFDADEDGFSRWFDRTTGSVVADPPDPVPEGWLDRHGWAIDPGCEPSTKTWAPRSSTPPGRSPRWWPL